MSNDDPFTSLRGAISQVSDLDADPNSVVRRVRRRVALRRIGLVTLVVVGLVGLSSVYSSRRGDDQVAVVSAPPTMTEDPLLRGVAPRVGFSDGRRVLFVRSVHGERLGLGVPEEMAGWDRAYARPSLPVRVQDAADTPRTVLAAAPARELVEARCERVPTNACNAPRQVGEPRNTPSGSEFQIWELEGTSERIATLSMERWTLMLEGGDTAHAERIAEALNWSVDTDGFLVVSSRSADVVIDREHASVVLVLQGGGQPEDTTSVALSPECRRNEWADTGASASQPPRIESWCHDGVQFEVTGPRSFIDEIRRSAVVER